jgi:hypothetical protein
MQPHHYRFAVGSIIGLLIGAAVAGGLFWAYEFFWARFQPRILTKDAAQIQRLLDEGDWISPGRSGRALYMVVYRDCDACLAYQRQEFPKLAAVNVDTRVLVFVRPDEGGEALSSPSERSTVAELWINRNWDFYEKWTATPEGDWAPQGLRPSDNDWARSAVVTATHLYVDKLTSLLHENGLNGSDPILIWRDQKGRLKACSCTDRLSYHFVRSDFGAPANAPPAPPPAPKPAQTPSQTPAPTAAPASAAAPGSAPGSASGSPAAAQTPAKAAPGAAAMPAASPPPAAAPAPASSAPASSARAPAAPVRSSGASSAPAVALAQKPLARGAGSANDTFY